MNMRHALVSATFLAALAAPDGAVRAQQSIDVTEVLRQARRYSYQAREGHYEVAPAAVALLEDATGKRPDSAALWTAMSTAYFLEATLAGQPGKNPVDAFPAIAKASRAAERALAIEPDNPEALSSYGAALTIRALIERKPDLVSEGVAKMDRAVALAPAMTVPRLSRAFFGVNLPPPVRNADVVADDLTRLQRLAEGTRAGDMLHILLGDLYAETGRQHDARREYERAAAAGSKVTDTARARLAALGQGGVPAAEIGALRGNLGTGCVMCHAR
jgi:tetratricopeptide (TPR) repeat protein